MELTRDWESLGNAPLLADQKQAALPFRASMGLSQAGRSPSFDPSNNPLPILSSLLSLCFLAHLRHLNASVVQHRLPPALSHSYILTDSFKTDLAQSQHNSRWSPNLPSSPLHPLT
jgi:hypothetical protein